MGIDYNELPNDAINLIRDLRKENELLKNCLNEKIEKKRFKERLLEQKLQDALEECEFLTNIITELRFNFYYVDDFMNKLNKKLECNK